PGFCASLRAVGWLEGEAGNLTLPRFTEHNGKTAKARADAAMRQARSRSQKLVTDVTEICDESVTAVTRPLIPRPLRRAIMNRDGWTCVYCGIESSEKEESSSRTSRLSIDHLKPVSKGGTND